MVELTGTVMTIAFVLAVLIERSLDLLFDWRHFRSRVEGKGLKVPISFGVSMLVVKVAHFDVIAQLTNTDMTTVGLMLTASLLAGGSKGLAKTWGRLKDGMVK